jgi:hypothetical protein|tara:strand:- start:11 stop:328 length:318 start_codon:yes stop_codon:yes gene_type:complete
MPFDMDKEIVYSKTEVDRLIATAKDEAIEEAREIDRASMAKHNWTATLVSMLLGFTTLGLYLDGFLRVIGIIPPFMDIDVNIVDQITEKVINDVIPYIQQYIPGI